MKAETIQPEIPAQSSLRDIVGGLANDAGNLVRGEVALARAELEQKTTRLVSGLVSLFGAMLLAFAGLIIVLLAAAQALAYVMPRWAALLIVGAIVLAIGVAMALAARNALSPSGMVPARTVDNLRTDAEVVKEHAT
jgi:uncharacterized membrane protein YqjE